MTINHVNILSNLPATISETIIYVEEYESHSAKRYRLWVSDLEYYVMFNHNEQDHFTRKYVCTTKVIEKLRARGIRLPTVPLISNEEKNGK